MKRKNNNRGFTLVELIIAVAILALAISPLIANFIQSSKINLKGRQTLDAMNLAQDIMEGLSGYSADDIEKTIDKVVNDATGTESLKGNILPLTAEYTSVTKESLVGDPVLEYKINHVDSIGDVKNTYDVELILDPTGTGQEDFNEQQMAGISQINQYYDAVFTIPSNDVGSGIAALQDMADFTLSSDEYYGKLRRTTTISIENTGSEAVPNYIVSVNRTYAARSGYEATLGLEATESATITSGNISRMDSDQFPRSVYIYFTGIEGATYSEMNRLENFVVKNSTGLPIDVYIIRTQIVDSLVGVSNADVVYGQTFGGRIDVESTNPAGEQTQDVHIVTNLRYDLNATEMRYNFRVNDENGDPLYDELNNFEPVNENIPDLPTTDDGTKIEPISSTYKSERALLYYNGVQVDETVFLANFSDGYKREKKNTLYKVTINLYDPDSGEKMATYDGGISN